MYPQTWKNITIAFAVLSAAVLLGFTNGFGINVNSNLFNTGLYMNVVLGAIQIVFAIALWRNMI